MKRWQYYPSFRQVIIAATLFWVICCSVVLWRFYTFYPSDISFDQGIFNQVFWNSLHGHFFQSSLSSTESSAVIYENHVPDVSYRRLAQHFTPALMVWLPVYALFPSPAGLSILQVTLVTAGGLVLYALARHYHPPALSSLIAISYYCANAVIGPTVANFHDLCQLPLFIFGLLLALEKRHWLWFGILVLLVLAVREDTGIVLFGFGLYLMVSRRYVKIGAAICCLCVAYIVLLTNVVLPSLSDDISKRFLVEQYGQFVNIPNPTVWQVLWGMISQPGLLLYELVTPFDRTINYFLAQWVPLAFIPSISPITWTIIGVPLFHLLIQKDPDSLLLSLRYAINLVPGLFYGTILWWAKHPVHFQPRLHQFWIFCLILAVGFTIASNPNRAFSMAIPDSLQPLVYITPPRQIQHAQAVQRLLREISAEASVSATGHIVAHVSNRRAVVRFPELRIRGDNHKAKQVEYVIVDLWYPQQQQSAFINELGFLKSTTRKLSDLFDNTRYQLIDFQDGVALIKRGATPNPKAVTDWQTFLQKITPNMSSS
jgi:uncharacterized membrane protein